MALVLPAGAADCPSGCSCLSPSDAQARGLQYCGGKAEICGYDNARSPMYCYGGTFTIVTRIITLAPLATITATPVPPACPAGCECLTGAAATQKYGSYTRCTEQVCGYEQVVTHVADPIPKYCVRGPQPGTCPGGCECMLESAAQERFGSYERCSASPCYTVVTGSATISAYCFRQAVVTPMVTCPSGCECLTDAAAAAKGGTWTRCSAEICGYDQPLTHIANPVPKYCMRQQQEQVCPAGCGCLPETDAVAKGLERCDPAAQPCAYQPVSLAANIPDSGKPSYCYLLPVSTVTPAPICPEDCTCMSETAAKERFGTYSRCSDLVCGSDPAAALTHLTPQYCFRQGTTVPPETTCRYDLQMNACTGSCAVPGEICQVNTLMRDASGAVIWGECHCKAGGTEQTPGAPCSCDPTRGGCTGTCPAGQVCWVTGSQTGAAGAAECTACDCMQLCAPGADNRCTGVCPAGGTCTAITVTDSQGMQKEGCGCDGTLPGAAPKLGEQPPDVFSSIGNFFRSLFGWK